MTEIFFTPSYEIKVKKLLRKYPEIKTQYRHTIEMLSIDFRHPSLKLHKLTGKPKDFSSISINYSMRIALTFLADKNGILLIDIGTHDEVYK